MRPNEFLVSILNETIEKFIATDEELQAQGARLNQFLVEDTEKDKVIEDLQDRVEFLEVKNQALTGSLEEFDKKHDDQIDEYRYKTQVAESHARTAKSKETEMEFKLKEAMNTSANWRIEAERWRGHYERISSEFQAYKAAKSNGDTHVECTNELDIRDIGSVLDGDLPPVEPTVISFSYDDTEC
jgi:hypothetical protein